MPSVRINAASVLRFLAKAAAAAEVTAGVVAEAEVVHRHRLMIMVVEVMMGIMTAMMMSKGHRFKDCNSDDAANANWMSSAMGPQMAVWRTD